MPEIAVPPASAPAAPARKRPRRDLGGLPWFALAIFPVLLVCAVGGEALLPHDPNGLDLGLAFQPPAWLAGGSWAYPLGTDNMGRDLLSRIMAGTRISLVVALYAILISGGIGTAAGMLAGYFGGRLDAFIMRLVDIQMSIPALALALVLAAVLGPGFNTWCW